MRKIAFVLFCLVPLVGCSADKKEVESYVDEKVANTSTEEQQKNNVVHNSNSSELIIGLWVLITGDDTFFNELDRIDQTQFIKIENDSSVHLVIDGITADGVIQKAKSGWDFHSDYGLFHISKVRALDPFEDGTIGLSMKSPVDDITLGYFKNIEELE